MLKFKYKGRSFSSGKSLANAMQRDMNQAVERKIRSAASASGARVRKTSQGFEVEGDAVRMDRFHDRLAR